MAELPLPEDGTLERLTAVSRALTYAVSLDEVLQITVETARDLLGAPRVVLMLQEDDDLLHVRAARGIDPETVARFREPLDERLIARLSAVFGTDAKARFLGVPLVVRGRVIGLLAVLRRGGDPEPRDEWLLSALADQASVALESARQEVAGTTMRGQVRDMEETDRRRREALRIIGHDMRSPLSSLRGYLHLLRDEHYGPVSEAQAAALDRIGSITGHLESLVTSALEMTRLADGRLTLVCGPVPVRPVLEEAAALVELRAGEAGITMRVDAPQDLVAIADHDRLRQVLVQLLDNALRFSPDRAEIRLVAGRDPEAPDHVSIRVRDQGPGIDPEQWEAVFEPYRRLGDSGAGFGLGLAIARGIVEVMDGTLALHDDASPGATFLLRLPLA